MLQVRILMGAVLILLTFFLFRIKKINNLLKDIFNWFDLKIFMIFKQGTCPFSLHYFRFYASNITI